MGTAWIVPASAFATCPKYSMAATHWDRYKDDGRCNCGRICGYSDDQGGPCVLLYEGHPLRQGVKVHDDGQRWTKGTWRR